MLNWRDDKKWSDIFLPEIKRILGEYLIGEPPIEEDMERNTDLVVLKLETVRVGCRIRRAEYYDKYSDDFTIRYTRPNGTKTELTKIIEGWGDYFFYGFGRDTGELIAWRLAKLTEFRIWYMRELYRQLIKAKKGKSYIPILPGDVMQNSDNSSELIVFRWSDIPEEFIVASKDYERENDIIPNVANKHIVKKRIDFLHVS